MRRLPVSTSATLLALFVATSCTDSTPPTSSWTVADSAHVTIGADPDAVEFLTAVAGASRLPDGSIVVGDRGDHALVYFDSTGTFQQKRVRKGKGPGELNFLGGAGILRCGDIIHGSDLDGRTQNHFRLDGSFVRQFHFAHLPYRMGCNATGQYVAYGWPSGATSGIHRTTTGYWILSDDSTANMLLGRFDGSERHEMRPLPLGKEPRVAISSQRVYIALADSFFVRVFDLRGRELEPLHLATPTAEVTEADWNAELEREVAMLGEQLRPIITRMYSELPRPRHLPATRDLVVDALDNVWVQHFPRANSRTVAWSVFSSEGRHVANVALPTDLELYEAGEDYVLGRMVNATTELPEVRLYRLIRGER